MVSREDFNSISPEDQAAWYAQYGQSAPYFWMAENGMEVKPAAQGFYAIPPAEQATWYGVYGEDAAEQWSIQNASAAGSANPAGAGDASGAAGAGGSRAGQPGDDTGSRVGTGKYPGAPGVYGTKDAGTVAASTWGKQEPGRNEGWGSIGAGTAGIQYGYGGDWHRPGESIKLYEPDLPHLFNPKIAPGYIPGSATYNQYSLAEADQKPRFEGAPRGLFQTLKGPGGQDEVVNSRFGLGGTGDPTTGGERQTPQRYITGVATDSARSEQGDEAWRRKYGGGGGDVIAPPPSSISFSRGPAALVGPMPGGGGGGQGGGENSFFGSTVTSNWGQTQETSGKDYIATLFLRSDTPTGIGTPAYSAPASMWQGLADEIAAGRIYVKNPQAWEMLKEKGYTPQQIGGKATGGQNVPPGGGAAGTAGKPDNQFGSTLPEGADTPFGKIQGGLPGGFGYEWNRLLVEKAQAEADRAIEEAKVTGKFNGLDTIAAQELAEKIRDNAAKNEIAKRLADNTIRQTDLDEAYRRDQLKQAQQKLDADINQKQQEIDNLLRAGDMDRAQREQENLRLMEQQKAELAEKTGEALGVIGGQDTLEMQKFKADQAQQAYERAANPARAFENELARGATGWNTPMQGPWGTTVGTPNAQNALGQGAATQAQGMPSYNYGQPISFGYPGQVTGQPLPGSPEAVAQAQGPGAGTAPAAGAQQATAAAGTTPGAGAPEAQASGATAQDAAATGAPAAGSSDQQYADYAAKMWAESQQQAQQAQGAQQQPGNTAYPGYGAPAANYGYGSQGAAGLGQPDLNQVQVRTPAAVNAFKQGAAMPTAGQYGTNSTSESAQNAAVTGRQVRTQNLKSTRRMAPVARQVVQSYASAGGTDADTFKQFTDRGAAGSSANAGGYAIK